MDDQPGGLVDDDQMCILEADIERDRLRCRRRLLDPGEDYDEILVASHAQRGIAQNRSLMRDLAGFDQTFEPRPRQLRQMLRQHAIEALPGIGFGRPDRDCVIGIGSPWPGLARPPTSFLQRHCHVLTF